jgi:trk system potassium uptake protein TrkH
VTTAARARRGLLGVDVAAALSLVGTLMKYLSPAALFPAVLAVGYDEPVWPFLATGLITAALGLALENAGRRERVGVREGFLVVTVTWLLAAGFGALPYLFSGEDQLANPVDAYFESMSGFTTTGASILTDIEGLPRSLLMWRQFTTWLGGSGFIVLALAVLPRLRVGGRQMLESEAPGPEMEGLRTTIRDAARRFIGLYVGVTTLMILTLALIGWTGLDDRMTLFDAVGHSFATMATAGFSTHSRSFEYFGPATQWAVVFFMVVAGTNFALMYRAVIGRRPRAFGRDEEFRAYTALLALGSALLFVELATEGIYAGEEAVRQAVFNGVSTMTTTGFASADFNLWTTFTAITLVALMFFGASAGSTSGSVKVVRHLLVAKMLRRELAQTVHPELVSTVRLNRQLVDERALGAVIVFVLLYVGIFAVGAFLIVADAARVDLAIAPLDAIAASATTLGNVGPAFGIAGPMGSFAGYSDFSKVVMIGLMYVGRLEIIPVAVLLTRNYWRV